MRIKKSLDEIRNLFDLNDKVAVVTGASGALGRAVSLGLAAHGVDIVASSDEEDALDDLCQEIRDTTGRGALPEKHPLMEVRSAFLMLGWLSMPIYMVGTMGAKVGLNLEIASSSGSG